MTGGGTRTLSTANGQVTLDLSPLTGEIINRLRERRIDIVDRIPADQLDTRFVIFESKALADVQAGVRVLEHLAIWFPLVACLSLVGSFAVSVNRRQTLLWTGLGLAAAMGVCLMLLAFGRSWSVSQLPPGINRDAATAFFYAIGRYPRDGLRLFSLLGLLLAALLFVTRPEGWLRRQQNEAWRSVKSAWRSGVARWPEVDKVATWSNEHIAPLAIGLGVGCCLLVIAVDPLTVTWATAVVIILALGIVVLSLLRSRKGEPALAVAASSLTFPRHGAFVASADVSTGAGIAASVFDDDRLNLVALAGELSTDDVRVLRRLALVLRNCR